MIISEYSNVVYLLVSVVSERECQSCQAGWKASQSSCYAYNNPPDRKDWRTWEEAQEDCRGKNSDLAVIVNELEKVMRKLWEYL